MLLLALLPLWTAGQGIEFRDMPLEKALETAAKEKKMVFIDFYTTWCGPCKTLSNEVFPQKEVGDFFNARFVSLKCDAEKGDGPALARKYGVRAYPTLAFLNADGTLAYSFAGALDAASLIERVRRGIDPDLAPDKLQARYDSGERTPELIYYHAITLFENGKDDEANAVISDYFQSLSDRKKSSPDNFAIYERYILNLDNPVAQYVVEHHDRFFKTVGEERARRLMRKWLWQETMPYVIARDNEIDAAEHEIEHRCLTLFLRQQPVAGDLRKVSTALKMVTDIERIADQASDIAEITLHLHPEGARTVGVMDDLDKMGEVALRMVKDAIGAYVQVDLATAAEVIARDDQADKSFVRISGEIAKYIAAHPTQAETALDLFMVTKYLERLGDHAVNVAEWVEFLKTGVHKSRKIV